jgi:ABC-type multidrug transport system fused ATPase/permease subunit
VNDIVSHVPTIPGVDLSLNGVPRADHAQGAPARAGTMGPLFQLLGYLKGQRKYVGLTLLFGTVGFTLSFVYPWLIGSVIDTVVTTTSRPWMERRARLIWLTELGVGAAFLHAVVVYGRGHFNVHLGDRIMVDLRRQLFEHLQRLSLRFYAKERTGAVLSRVLHDVHEATSIIYNGLIVAGMDGVQLVIALVLLTSISFKLTVACTLLFPLYGVVFWRMSPRVRRASERMQAQFSRISGNVAERLSGQALVKMYTAEPIEAKRFAKDVELHHQLVVAQSHEGHMVAAWGEILVHLGTTIVIGYGGWLALAGQMSAGMMTRFLGYVAIMYGPVRRFAELNIAYQSSLSAMRRVFSVLSIRPAIVEPQHAIAAPPSRGHVRFEQVRFRYQDDTDEGRIAIEDDGERRSMTDAAWVLEGVTMEAAPGERIAIVGPSGAGKTTLVSLLPRLYDATQGRILIDGVDVREYSLSALRSAIGMVAQDSFVFTGTVRDNIAYGRPDATEQEIIDAAIAAHADEFIARFPEGYDTWLGERGVNLSGGQKQRLSIARALLKNPRILVLDEATSSLDAESEAIVQEALERLMRGRTCFVIAHRLSTIRNADRIFVLKEGRVVESGSHLELLSREGTYATLVRHQTSI